MKYLRSKSIVVILALSALGLVSKNMILPFFHTVRPLSQVEINEEVDQQAREFFQQIEYTTGKSTPMTDIEKLGWAFDYVRDPFNIQTKVEVVTEEEEPPRNDVLVAVVQEPGKSLAVINDVIVGEGDYYEDFRVIKIGSDSVELEGPDGNKTLEF